MYTTCPSLVVCAEGFPSAVAAPGLPSMYLHYGWKLQGFLQEASPISTISFFINLTEIALDRVRHIHVIKSQNIALLFHFIIARHMVHPGASHRDLILRQWDSQQEGWDQSLPHNLPEQRKEHLFESSRYVEISDTLNVSKFHPSNWSF